MFKQSLIPGFPVGAQRIGEALSILEKDDWVTYFVGADNYFSHPKEDIKSRRFALASRMENGHVRACDLAPLPLLIAHRTLMNWTAQYRKDGSASFFRIANGSKPRVMTAGKSAQCARILSDGVQPSEAARRAGINESTLRKALKREAIPRIAQCADERNDKDAGSTKAQRSRDDAQAASGMGTAGTRADERVAAAMGLAQCATARF